MTPEERTILTKRLAEAEQAYHELKMGTAAVSIRDSNGEQVEYQRASASGLAQYITTLKAQLGKGGIGRPMRPLL